MHKIKILVLASALSLGTTAVIAQSNMGATPGKNAPDATNAGSSGTAKSSTTVNSNASTKASSPRAAAGTKINVDAAKKNVDASNKNVDAATKATKKPDGKSAKKIGRGHAAYARAMNGQGAYAQAQRDRYSAIVNNRVVGRDPDARIRFELRRDDPARRG